MNACRDTRALLDDWLDDLCEAETRAEIEAHLSGCQECTRLFADHKAFSGDLLSLARTADRMADTVTSGVASPRKRRWRPLMRIAAAVVIVAGASLYFVGPWRPGAPGHLAEISLPRDDVTQEPAPVGFRVALAEHQMAVPIQSANPRVHIVWIYNEMVPPEASAGDEAGNTSTKPS